MADRVIQRNDTAANWAAVNPILATGEIGIEIDGAKGYKIGDGQTRWNDLPYPGNPASIVQELGDDENAVVSQKVVTEKFTELEQGVFLDISNLQLKTYGITEVIAKDRKINQTYKVKLCLLSGTQYEYVGTGEGAAAVHLLYEDGTTESLKSGSAIFSGESCIFTPSLNVTELSCYVVDDSNHGFIIKTSSNIKKELSDAKGDIESLEVKSVTSTLNTSQLALKLNGEFVIEPIDVPSTTYNSVVKLLANKSYTYIGSGDASVAAILVFEDGTTEYLFGGAGIPPGVEKVFVPTKDVVEISFYVSTGSTHGFSIQTAGEVPVLKDSLAIESLKNSVKNDSCKVLTSQELQLYEGMCYGEVGETVQYTISGAGRYHYSIDIDRNDNIIDCVVGYYSSLGSDVVFLDENNVIIAKYSTTGNMTIRTFAIPEGCAKIEIPISTTDGSYKTIFYVKLLSIGKKSRIMPYQKRSGYYMQSDGNIANDITTQTLYYFDVSNVSRAIINYVLNVSEPVLNYAIYSSKEVQDSSTLIYAGKYSRTGLGPNSYMAAVFDIPREGAVLVVTGRNRDSLCYGDVVTSIQGGHIKTLDENDYEVKTGIPQGSVGDTELTVVSSSLWRYAIIPFDANYDIICFKEVYSSLGSYILQLDANGVIVYSKKVTRSQRNNIAITKAENAVSFVYSYSTDEGFTAFMAKLLPIPFMQPNVKFGYNTDGAKTNFNNTIQGYKVDVQNAKYIFAKVREYSGSSVATFAFVDPFDNFISYQNTMSPSIYDGIVWAKVPDEAKYVYISSRDYITADNDVVIPDFWVDNETAKMKNENNNAFASGLYQNNYSYIGERINLRGFDCCKIGRGIIQTYIPNPYDSEGDELSGQGCAVFEQYLFRFHDKGYTTIYDLSNMNNVVKVGEFALGSYLDENHMNSAQFGNVIDAESGFPLLYCAGLYGNKCYVERINLEGSTLLQTITIATSALEDTEYACDVQIGDDGYLWAIGSRIIGNSGKRLFYKFNLPDVSLGDVTLSDSDIIDSWEEEGYSFHISQAQGKTVKNGYIYWLGGASSVHDDGVRRRELNVYDTTTHKKVSYVNLTDIILQEPEDCDIINGKMIVVVNGSTAQYAYILDFK